MLYIDLILSNHFNSSIRFKFAANLNHSHDLTTRTLDHVHALKLESCIPLQACNNIA